MGAGRRLRHAVSSPLAIDASAHSVDAGGRDLSESGLPIRPHPVSSAQPAGTRKREAARWRSFPLQVLSSRAPEGAHLK
jgi:hypothetical protein